MAPAVNRSLLRMWQTYLISATESGHRLHALNLILWIKQMNHLMELSGYKTAFCSWPGKVRALPGVSVAWGGRKARLLRVSPLNLFYFVFHQLFDSLAVLSC